MDLARLTSSARFDNRAFTTDEISQIVQSTRLLGLSFTNCPVTDDDILQLSTLPKLINVSLENTEITDQALEYLSRLPHLKYLFITGANLTGSGFRYFENNKKIDCVWACSTKLDDENLKLLAKIPKLGTLVINNTKVTFEGLLAIAWNPRIHVTGNDIFTKEEIGRFEQEQRTLARKNTATNDHDVGSAKETLLSFFKEMTAWEQYAAAHGFTEEVGTRCKEIFKKFCVDKPRSGYRPEGLHFSGAPDYTYGSDEFVDVEQIAKNKILFYTKDSIDFKYRYVMVKKEGHWRIDERQWQSAGWKKQGL